MESGGNKFNTSGENEGVSFIFFVPDFVHNKFVI